MFLINKYIIHKCSKSENIQPFCISNIYNIHYHITCMTLRFIFNT